MPPLDTARRRRSQTERRDESARLLIEGAMRVVARDGVAAATFESIGREAGYSRGLATQKFGSKQGLTEAVIAYLHRRREAILEAEHVADMPALEAILHYAEGHLRELSRDQGGKAYFMLLAAAVADSTALREAFAASHEKVRHWLREQILRGQAAGEIRPEADADAEALMIGSLLLGISLQWLVDPTLDVARVASSSLDALRRSLAADPAVRRGGSP